MCNCVCHTFKSIEVPVVCLQCDMDQACADSKNAIKHRVMDALHSIVPDGVHATVLLYFPDATGTDIVICSTLPRTLLDKMLQATLDARPKE